MAKLEELLTPMYPVQPVQPRAVGGGRRQPTWKDLYESRESEYGYARLEREEQARRAQEDLNRLAAHHQLVLEDEMRSEQFTRLSNAGKVEMLDKMNELFRKDINQKYATDIMSRHVLYDAIGVQIQQTKDKIRSEESYGTGGPGYVLAGIGGGVVRMGSAIGSGLLDLGGRAVGALGAENYGATMQDMAGDLSQFANEAFDIIIRTTDAGEEYRKRYAEIAAQKGDDFTVFDVLGDKYLSPVVRGWSIAEAVAEQVPQFVLSGYVLKAGALLKGAMMASLPARVGTAARAISASTGAAATTAKATGAVAGRLAAFGLPAGLQVMSEHIAEFENLKEYTDPRTGIKPGLEILRQSPMYKDLRAQGMTHDQALRTMRNQGATWSLIYATAANGTLGAAMDIVTLNAVQSLFGRSVARRIAGGWGKRLTYGGGVWFGTAGLETATEGIERFGRAMGEGQAGYSSQPQRSLWGIVKEDAAEAVISSLFFGAGSGVQMARRIGPAQPAPTVAQLGSPTVYGELHAAVQQMIAHRESQGNPLTAEQKMAMGNTLMSFARNEMALDDVHLALYRESGLWFEDLAQHPDQSAAILMLHGSRLSQSRTFDRTQRERFIELKNKIAAGQLNSAEFAELAALVAAGNSKNPNVNRTPVFVAMPAGFTATPVSSPFPSTVTARSQIARMRGNVQASFDEAVKRADDIIASNTAGFASLTDAQKQALWDKDIKDLADALGLTMPGVNRSNIKLSDFQSLRKALRKKADQRIKAYNQYLADLEKVADQTDSRAVGDALARLEADLPFGMGKLAAAPPSQPRPRCSVWPRWKRPWPRPPSGIPPSPRCWPISRQSSTNRPRRPP